MRVCTPESSPKAKIMPFSTDNEYGSYRKMIVSIIGLCSIFLPRFDNCSMFGKGLPHMEIDVNYLGNEGPIKLINTLS